MSAPLPAPRPTVVSACHSDGAILFSPDANSYYGLDPVGLRIWELLGAQGLTFDELCDAVRAFWPEGDERAMRADVTDLCADLVRWHFADSAPTEQATTAH